MKSTNCLLFTRSAMQCVLPCTVGCFDTTESWLIGTRLATDQEASWADFPVVSFLFGFLAQNKYKSNDKKYRMSQKSTRDGGQEPRCYMYHLWKLDWIGAKMVMSAALVRVAKLLNKFFIRFWSIMTMMTKVMMTMMAMSDGWSVKGNQRGGHSIAALGKSHNPNAAEKIPHEHFILDEKKIQHVERILH